VSSEAESYDNYEAYNVALYGSPEPPRALPLRSGEQQQHHNGDLSDRIPHSEVTMEDKMFSLEAFCNLECGDDGGTCLMEDAETDSIKKRCLCPLGKTGERCAFGKLTTYILICIYQQRVSTGQDSPGQSRAVQGSPGLS
jgi:hypothetical protein